LILSKNEKEALVISLSEQGKTTRQIAKELHISLKEIGRILKKARGEEHFEEGRV
jgi:DNA invertase Pin-like site-specific DNA recombinase